MSGLSKEIAVAAALVSGMVLSGAPGAHADTIKWKDVGAWGISFYPIAAGCQALAVFEENTAFLIGFDNNDNILAIDVTFMDERWQSIEDGKEYAITLKFGDETPWTLNMDGRQYNSYPGLNILIDASSDEAELFIDEFQRETSMRLSFGQNQLGHYTLRGSRRAFDEVVSCQRSYFNALSSQSDPFATGGLRSSDPFAN